MSVSSNIHHTRENGSLFPAGSTSRKTRKWIPAFAGTLMFCLSPAFAQEKTAEPKTITTTEEAPVDPARLEVAEKTVNYLFPLGTYERMMKGTLDQLMDAVFSEVSEMSVGEMADAAGLPEEGLTDAQKKQSIGDVASEADPHFDERMKISTTVMMDEMIGLMTKMEPAIRGALTKIYAREYTALQLTEMNSFFATKTGGAFARDYMMVFVDPEMMQSMMGMVPEIMGSMPDIMKKVEEATAHLPPPPNGEGDDEEGAGGSVEETAETAEDGEGPWTEPQSWSEEDRALVQKLDVESDDAIDRYFEAKEAAIKAAKKRLKPAK